MKLFKKIMAALLITAAIAGLMYVGFRWDLEIDKYLYNPANKFALWAEVMGWWPLYMGIPLAGYVAVSYAKRAKKVWHITLLSALGIVLAFGGSYALCIPACKYLVQRGYGFWEGGTPWAVSVLFTAAVILAALITKPHRGTLLRLRTFAIISVAFAGVENIVINALKAVWNRTRFDNMIANGTLYKFTSWTDLNGNGGTSFPSGHTAAAAGILLCVFLCLLFEECRGEQGKFMFVGTVYTGAVAVGRLIIGRHFLSDTVAAYFIVCVLIAVAYYFPPLKKWVLKTAETARGYDERDGVKPNAEYTAQDNGAETAKKPRRIKKPKTEKKQEPGEENNNRPAADTKEKGEKTVYKKDK